MLQKQPLSEESENASSPVGMREDAENKLRQAAKQFKTKPTAENLRELERQAMRMLFADPKRSGEVLPLLKELTGDSSSQPPSNSVTKN